MELNIYNCKHEFITKINAKSEYDERIYRTRPYIGKRKAREILKMIHNGNPYKLNAVIEIEEIKTGRKYASMLLYDNGNYID